ncbi:MAG: aminotransferase class V-fold PLP-dependent enzyme [Bryobacteraceae bacterium]
MKRREFLGTAAVAAAAEASAEPDWAAIRKLFPRALNETYFNCAAQHPLAVHSVRAMQRYMDFLHLGPGEGREDLWETSFPKVKPAFARLIGAKPQEVALCPSTTVGENIVLNGMNLSGGNVVTNDLHYTASLANYLRRKRAGLDVRIVKHRDWRIDLKDMERAVDRKTKLIAVSLVSSVNGHLEKIKALSDLAHSHGAYLFGDIIQGAGAIPIDVHAMGIDMASCGMYKFLQGEHGWAFMYIREDLIGSVVKPTEFTGHPDFNYAPWVSQPKAGLPEFIAHDPKGIGDFEVGTPSVITFAAQYESLKFIEQLTIPRIRAHARPLIGRLRKGLSAAGYRPITPEDTETAILTFRSPDNNKTRDRILRANKEGRAKISITGPNSALTVGRFGDHLRFSVSVYNNQEDVDRIVQVLS